MEAVTILPPEVVEGMTPAEAKRYKTLLRRELARISPLDMAEQFDPDCSRWAHVELLNDHLVALTEYRLYRDGPGPPPVWRYRLEHGGELLTADHIGNIPWHLVPVEYWGHHPDNPAWLVVYRLAIAMPPRHGKSYLVSEWFPLWYWFRHPNRDIGLATYSDDFASSEWGTKLKDKLLEFGPDLGLTLRNGTRAATDHLRLEGTGVGRCRLVGAGGPTTGTGWVLGILDDPFKNDQDAMSPATRQQKDNWYHSTWTSRKTSTGKGYIPIEVMMFTRWHEDDLAGRNVYTDDGGINPDWCMLHLPALALEDDPLGREPGEELCAAIKTRAELEKLQVESPTWFAALYQGMPSLNESGTFAQFQTYRVATVGDEVQYVHAFGSTPVDECVRFQTVDLAATTQTYSDWSVVSTWDWHRVQQRLFLVHVVRERVESDTHATWLALNYDQKAVFMGIESRTFGLTALQAFRRSGGVPVKELKADSDKISRAIRAADMSRAGQILIPIAAPWRALWEAEHAGFPYAKHDDQVDNTAYAAIETLTMPAPIQRKKDPETMEERIDAYIRRKSKERQRHRRSLQGLM